MAGAVNTRSIGAVGVRQVSKIKRGKHAEVIFVIDHAHGWSGKLDGRFIAEHTAHDRPVRIVLIGVAAFTRIAVYIQLSVLELSSGSQYKVIGAIWKQEGVSITQQLCALEIKVSVGIRSPGR